MRHIAPLIVVLLVGTLAAAPVTKDDAQAIVGTWRVERFDCGAGERGDSARMTFHKDGTWTVTDVRDGVGRKSEGSYRLNPSTRVKEVDMTVGSGDLVGVYELEGDTLTLCLTRGDKSRPTEFEADGKDGKDGKDMVVTVLRRVKDE